MLVLSGEGKLGKNTTLTTADNQQSQFLEKIPINSPTGVDRGKNKQGEEEVRGKGRDMEPLTSWGGK